MKQKKMLLLTLSQLRQTYFQELPEITAIALASPTNEDFKADLSTYLDKFSATDEKTEEAREQIRTLLHYDGQEIHELSTGQKLLVKTISLLHQFLSGTLENTEMPTDLFIELFQVFRRLKGATTPPLSHQRIKSLSERWPDGLNKEVKEIRAENKERMIHLLIQKIENHPLVELKI